jgi:L,D-transpeptidase catalytic domain
MRGLLLVLLGAFAVSGCSHKTELETPPAPNTGNVVFEEDKSPVADQPAEINTPTDQPTSTPEESKPAPQPRPKPVVDNTVYYVYTNQLNVRSAPENKPENILGRLALNDEVHVVAEVSETQFVQIEITKSNEKIAQAAAYFVSKEYLSNKKNDSRAQDPRSRFFMVENVATEKLRVYEKGCDDGNCAHKLVLEADIAVGEKTKDEERMTVLGYFHITDWIKFYQDGAGVYPSWYDPALPMPPKPHASVMSWTSKSVLPNNKGAHVRGAFGWYAAMVGPNPHNQWTHGTIGWGADKDKYIRVTRGFWANLFTDPRSHGCTRTDNETISYVRHLLPVGTPMIKIYAVEELADPSLSRYSEKTKQWNYIMTKRGVRQSGGEEADRDYILAQNESSDQYLEQGTYTANVSPTVKKFKEGSAGAKASKNGNVYGLSQNEMQGSFLVDEGRLVDYVHPQSLTVGGYGRNELPSFLVKTAKVTQP